jgi:putative Ca2+/H+ antiporter (TMEM165/GDT1 family)
MKSAMLEEAHKALEAMSVAANAMKDEEWGEAERALITVQEFVARLLREVGDKTQEKLLFAKPEQGDRG